MGRFCTYSSAANDGIALRFSLTRFHGHILIPAPMMLSGTLTHGYLLHMLAVAILDPEVVRLATLSCPLRGEVLLTPRCDIHGLEMILPLVVVAILVGYAVPLTPPVT